jgi:hypothetical protein
MFWMAAWVLMDLKICVLPLVDGVVLFSLSMAG